MKCNESGQLEMKDHSIVDVNLVNSQNNGSTSTRDGIVEEWDLFK